MSWALQDSGENCNHNNGSDRNGTGLQNATEQNRKQACKREREMKWNKMNVRRSVVTLVYTSVCREREIMDYN